MEPLEQKEKSFHSDFKTLAQKSIGCSLSVPLLESRHKDLVGEEKFKVSTDKKVTELYYHLLQNRVNKLKREELLEQKKLQDKKRLEEEKAKIFRRKQEEHEFSASVKQHKQKDLIKIKESIQQMKNYHSQLMTEIKTQSIGLCHQLNTERKTEKQKHLRIRSELFEVARVENSKKASKIRESQKKLEKAREKNWKNFKEELKTKYKSRIEQEKQEKIECEKKLRALEVEEQNLLQKLGKSQFTSETSN